ncbi:MAG: redoxin domain-containing protein, partial [Nitrospinota bacterium]
MSVNVGDQAPDFSAKATGDREIRLSDYRGKKNVMLAFFPFAFSPVCSEQIPEYSANADRFAALDVEVLAVSVDSPWSQNAWAEQYGIRFPVLSDFSKKITTDYGLLHEMGMSQRAVVIIDKDGKVAYKKVQENIREAPSLDEIFSQLEALK